MFKRKAPRICRPCQEHAHFACDGPKVCDCTLCEQLAELDAAAREKGEIMFPFPPPGP